jgi:hypothetical protein
VAVGKHLGGRALHHQLPVVEHVTAISDPEGGLHVLLDEEHGDIAVVGDLAHNRKESLDDDRGEAQAHLVDHQDLGVR